MTSCDHLCGWVRRCSVGYFEESVVKFDGSQTLALSSVVVINKPLGFVKCEWDDIDGGQMISFVLGLQVSMNSN